MTRIARAARVVTEVLIPVAGLIGFFVILLIAHHLGPYTVPALLAAGTMMGLRFPLQADQKAQDDRTRGPQ